MAITMMFPVDACCDECGTTVELGYKIDLRQIGRNDKLFSQRWCGKVANEVRHSLEEEGWMVEASGTWCPECAKLIERGEIKPGITVTDAAGMIRQIGFSLRHSGVKKEQ